MIMLDGTKLLIIKIKDPSTRYCFRAGWVITPKVFGRVKQRNIITKESPSAPKQPNTTNSTSTNTKPANRLNAKRSVISDNVRPGPYVVRVAMLSECPLYKACKTIDATNNAHPIIIEISLNFSLKIATTSFSNL